MPLIGQLHRQTVADCHDALMGAVGLVAGKEIDIRAKRGDIGKAVRHEADFDE